MMRLSALDGPKACPEVGWTVTIFGALSLNTDLFMSVVDMS